MVPVLLQLQPLEIIESTGLTRALMTTLYHLHSSIANKAGSVKEVRVKAVKAVRVEAIRVEAVRVKAVRVSKDNRLAVKATNRVAVEAIAKHPADRILATSSIQREPPFEPLHMLRL